MAKKLTTTELLNLTHQSFSEKLGVSTEQLINATNIYNQIFDGPTEEIIKQTLLKATEVKGKKDIGERYAVKMIKLGKIESLAQLTSIKGINLGTISTLVSPLAMFNLGHYMDRVYRDKPCCEWTRILEVADDKATIDGVLSHLHMYLGINGTGSAYATSSFFVDWFASTQVADSIESKVKFGLKNKRTCLNPDPEAKIKVSSFIKVSADSEAIDADTLASAAGYCNVSGDITFKDGAENKIAVNTGSEATDTEFGIGVITFKPFKKTEGKLAPLPALKSNDVIISKLEPEVTVDGAIGLKAYSNGDIGNASADVNYKFTGEIEIKCKNCSGTATIKF